MAQPVYKSEVFVPIKKDDKTFEDRQKSIWDDIQNHSLELHGKSLFSDMHSKMEQRRREWDMEVERMRRDFFQLRPTNIRPRQGSTENLLEKMRLDDLFIDDVKHAGDKKFCVSFDCRKFQPEEIDVRTEDMRLLVHAKHEEVHEGSKMCNEFSRSVDIPPHIDPHSLTSTLSKDGILQIEAPVAAPQYSLIQQASPPALKTMPPLTSGISMPKYSSGPIVTSEDGSRNLRLTVDIGTDFRPEDISMKTVDKKLLVKARHEEKSAGRTSIKEFSREFDLPEEVDPNLVTASMTDDGKLLVEAPISSYQQGSYQGAPGSSKQPQVTVHLR